MKTLLMVLGLVFSISSVSSAFCLKQYSRQMNRFTASLNSEAVKNNYAAVPPRIVSVEQQVVHRQK